MLSFQSLFASQRPGDLLFHRKRRVARCADVDLPTPRGCTPVEPGAVWTVDQAWSSHGRGASSQLFVLENITCFVKCETNASTKTKTMVSIIDTPMFLACFSEAINTFQW